MVFLLMPSTLVETMLLLIRQQQDAEALSLWEREWPLLAPDATLLEEIEISGILGTLDLEVVEASIGRARVDIR